MKQFLIALMAVVFNVYLTHAQQITGKIVDDKQQSVIGAEVLIEGTDIISYTNASGKFRLFDVPDGAQTLIVRLDDAELYRQQTDISGDMDLGTLEVAVSDAADEASDIAIVTLNDLTQETEEEGQDYSTVLSAGRDDFLSTAAFTFGSMRFRLRGMGSDFSTTYLNGVPMNELENGALYYGQWGGLNDVFRNVHTNHGMVASEYGIGGFLGNANINVRASDQRKQTKAQYAISNRSYRNRVMVTHSSGLNQNGWAYTVSGSRRWANEGYTPGSFYDAASFFVGVEKQLKSGSAIHLTVLGSPNKRGKSGAALPEIINITGDKYYNPYWGYQVGEKRNSRVGQSFQPIALLGYDWKISNQTKLNTAVSFQSGRNGGTALQWASGSNPAGDYHQKLPSRIENEETRQLVINAIKADPSYFQIPWDRFYQINQNNPYNVENVNGLNQTGVLNKSEYIIEDRRYDATELNFNTTLTHELSEQLTLNAGANHRMYNGHNFTEVNDLLGGDFYLDVDKYADPIGRPGTEQSDLNNPNRGVVEGDIFGYDYNSEIRSTAGWGQLQYRKGKIELFAGGELSRNSLQRIGNMKNGFFPDNSFGASEKLSYTNYKVKGGATYKLSGRQYLSANAMIGTRAPYFRDAFLNAQSNNSLVPNLDVVDMNSVEATYAYRSPGFSFKTTGYYADVNNDTEVLFFYAEEGIVNGDVTQSGGAFGAFTNTNIDTRYVGIESAISYKLNSQWSAKAVLALGQHLYDSRWVQYAQSEDLGIFRDSVTVYSKNFFVESSPQTAASFELKYSSPNFWFATINFNYFDRRYLDFGMDRRIAFNNKNFDDGSEALKNLVAQTKVDDAFTMDLFAYKSFKFGDYFLILTASVSNLLGTELITGGYEQLRYNAERGPDYFENKYYYGYGRNYFLGAAVRF